MQILESIFKIQDKDHKQKLHLLPKKKSCLSRRSDRALQQCSTSLYTCKETVLLNIIRMPRLFNIYRYSDYLLLSSFVSENYVLLNLSPITHFSVFSFLPISNYSLFLSLHSIPPPVISASIQELWGGGGSAAFSVVWGCGWAAMGVPSRTLPSSPPHTSSGPPMTHTAGEIKIVGSWQVILHVPFTNFENTHKD